MSRHSHVLLPLLVFAFIPPTTSCDTLSSLLDVQEPSALLAAIDLVQSPSTSELLAWACYEHMGSTTCSAVGFDEKPSKSDMRFSFDVAFDLFNPNASFSIPLFEMLLGFTVYEDTNLGAVCVSFCDPDDAGCAAQVDAEGACAGSDGAKGLEDFDPTLADLIELADDVASGDATRNWDWRVIPASFESNCQDEGVTCSEQTSGDSSEMCCNGECTALEQGCSVGRGESGNSCALCDGHTEAHITFDLGVDTMLSLSDHLLEDALDDFLAGTSVKIDVPYVAEGSLFFDVPDLGRYGVGFGPFEDTWRVKAD